MDAVGDTLSYESLEGQQNSNDFLKTPMKMDSVEEICRLCGEKSKNCIPIFDNNLSVAEKISRCLPIIVLATDNLPSEVCKRCLAHLNISYKLIVNSLKTDAYLREQFQAKIKSEGNEVESNKNLKQSTLNLMPKQSVVVSMKKLKKIAIHGPSSCEFCNIIFDDVKEFDKHFETNHILKWKCNFCDGSFQTSVELITHKAMTHAGNIIICKSCVDEETENVQDKKINVEESMRSSDDDNLDKFYLPVECMTQEFVEPIPDPLSRLNSVSTATKNIELTQPSIDSPTPSNSKGVECRKTSSMLPASFLVSPELTSKFLSRSANITPEITFTSSPNTAQLISNSNSPIHAENTVSFIPQLNGPRTKLANSLRNTSVAKLIKSVRFAMKEKLEEIQSGEKKVYMTCDVCHLRVDDRKLFELHLKIHQSRSMNCVLCKQECATIYDLYLHKREAHNLYSKVNLKYVCDKCGKFFSNSWQWETHKTRKCRNREGSKNCKYCDASFSTIHKLKRHLRKHKQEMMDDPTVEVFKCVSCPKIFVDEEFYQKHRNVHDPECWNKFKCATCDRSFRDNVRLKEHTKSIHEGIKPHACDMCGKTFHRLSNMKVHRALHFGHKCNHCDQVFEKVRQLATHIRDDHGLEPPASLIARKGYVSGTYICRYCGRILATHQSLLDHEHIHTGEKPYACHICNKSFRSYTARWSHVQRHEKGNFICEQCGKCFSFKQNLMTHVQIHVSMEERKHQCSTCHKKFLRKAHLNVHMRIHEGIRPYTCDICNFSFTQIGDMRRHRARHEHGEVRKRQPRQKIENVKWNFETSNDDSN